MAGKVLKFVGIKHDDFQFNYEYAVLNITAKVYGKGNFDCQI